MVLPQASVQLYSLADEFSADMGGSLHRLAAAGFECVEAFDFVHRAAAIREQLDTAGLTCPTGHAPLLSDVLWTPDGVIPSPPPEVVFESAAIVGMSLVIDPFVAAERWFNPAEVAAIADRFNALVDIAADFGVSVGYHNHAQEFVMDFDGRTAYEYFVDATDPRVALELDLFWALTGGQDVVDLVTRLGDRLVAVHVKDGVVPPTNPWAPGAPEFGSNSLDQRPAGRGDVPVADALRSAPDLRYAVVEYDNPPGDVFVDVAESLSYLREQGLVQ